MLIRLLMVSIARLDWLQQQVLGGRNACVRFSFNVSTGTERIQFVLDPRNDDSCQVVHDQRQCSTRRVALTAALAAVREVAINNVTTDKGHKSSRGSSIITFWIRAPDSHHRVNGGGGNGGGGRGAKVSTPDARPDERPDALDVRGGGIGGGFGVAEEGTSDARPGTRHNAKPDQNAQTDEFVNAGNTPDNGANEQPEPKRSRHDVLVLEPFVKMPMVHPHAPSAEQSVVTDDPTTNGGGIAPLVLPREHFCIPARVSAAVVEASCQFNGRSHRDTQNFGLCFVQCEEVRW